MVAPKDIPDRLIDTLLANDQEPDTCLGKTVFCNNGLSRSCSAHCKPRLTHHLGHEKHGKVVNADGPPPERHEQKTPEEAKQLLAHGRPP